MPSRSTNAPKSTMFEIWPSMTRPGCRRSRIAWRCSLRSSSRTARRRQHDVVARAVELYDLGLDVLAEVLVEVRHAADVHQRGGQEAAHAEVDDQAALDDLDHRAGDGLAGLGGALDAAPGALEASTLLGQDQAAVLILLREDEGVDLFSELDLLGRVHGLTDRELVVGDNPFALVSDIDEDLVLVDPHDLAGDDVAFFEGDDRRVVVGKDLTINLDQHPVRALDDVNFRRGFWGQSGFHQRRDTVANMPVRATKRGAERTPLSGDFDVVICGASFAGLPVARELRATGARVLVLDRYEIGERQTSACAAPTEWLRNLGLEDSILQTFDSLVVHTPGDQRPLADRLGVLDLRLPAPVRAAVGRSAAGPSSRPPRSTAAPAPPSTPTAAT